MPHETLSHPQGAGWQAPRQRHPGVRGCPGPWAAPGETLQDRGWAAACPAACSPRPPAPSTPAPAPAWPLQHIWKESHLSPLATQRVGSKVCAGFVPGKSGRDFARCQGGWGALSGALGSNGHLSTATSSPLQATTQPCSLSGSRHCSSFGPQHTGSHCPREPHPRQFSRPCQDGPPTAPRAALELSLSEGSSAGCGRSGR